MLVLDMRATFPQTAPTRKWKQRKKKRKSEGSSMIKSNLPLKTVWETWVEYYRNLWNPTLKVGGILPTQVLILNVS